MQPTPPTVSPSLHNRAASSGTDTSTARFVGVDIARFLAIIGMMATHLLAVNAMNPGASELDQTIGTFAETFTSGIAAPLFALLGGLSMVFATRRLLREKRVGGAIAAIALRGAILVLIGMLLGLIESPIVVVLAYYGVAMLLLAPLIAARSWILASLATVLAVAGGALNAAVRTELGVVGEGGSVTFEAFFNAPSKTSGRCCSRGNILQSRGSYTCSLVF
ncbi:DUF1624 domain-containing protein [Leucobacter coleopterorum]|uniref:DUF1624 domain-containing protein n=1 Tax=Leucobacter coleopterorum TaxID=2714933 RepID=A0ABX6JX05_9MICO|nr:heparan-alpha-glucosaminide N-acetyltransferase domain-containing protein [Leucobacter coleopterorum]QIM18838.1 DUF1624 domain-containing protein [Leucobacter coleopterorum]